MGSLVSQSATEVDDLKQDSWISDTRSRRFIRRSIITHQVYSYSDTPVPPGLNHAIVKTPTPIEVRQRAAHESDHDLPATDQTTNNADTKPTTDEPVTATSSFPTHTKEKLINMQKADPNAEGWSYN